MQHDDLSTLSKVGYLSALRSLSEIPPSPSLASLFCRNFTIYKHCSIVETGINCQNQIQRTEIQSTSNKGLEIHGRLIQNFNCKVSCLFFFFYFS